MGCQAGSFTSTHSLSQHLEQHQFIHLQLITTNINHMLIQMTELNQKMTHMNDRMDTLTNQIKQCEEQIKLLRSEQTNVQLNINMN